MNWNTDLKRFAVLALAVMLVFQVSLMEAKGEASKYTVTGTTTGSSDTAIASLNGKTLMLGTTDSYALNAASSGLTAVKYTNVSATITAESALTQWTFEMVTNPVNGYYPYYISTVLDGTTYYLGYSGNDIQLTTSKQYVYVRRRSSAIEISNGTSDQRYRLRISDDRTGFTTRKNNDGDVWKLTAYALTQVSGGGDDPTPYNGRSFNKEELQRWMDELKEKQLPLDPSDLNKTAAAADYANRIYKVDITARSNLATYAGIVDIGFILDVSGSMQFPSKLVPVEGKGDFDINHINDSTQNKNQLDTGKEYFIIAEKNTRATVYRLWYENGDWYRIDASYTKSTSGNKIAADTRFGKDAAGTLYPIYADGDNGKQRKDYLEGSVGNTITDLKAIMDKISLASNASVDPDVKVAWNTFCAQLLNLNHTFTSVSDGINIVYDYSGGTRTDTALSDALRFGWEASATKYAILITDGAPQYGGNQHPSDLNNDLAKETERLCEEAAKYAQQLKDEGITLITVGLSMKDVTRGSKLLHDISSVDENGTPYFYEAESGDELQAILYGIIKDIMAEAIVQGDITDTIDGIFYPVTADGTPLDQNDLIALDGSYFGKLSGNNIYDANGSPVGTKVTNDGRTTFRDTEGNPLPLGLIGLNGENYTLTWPDQDIPWDSWTGSVYVKAREDFLGGNTISTNTSASVYAHSYKVDTNSDSYALKADKIATYSLETPYVNVDELALDQSETEWTVHLGTDVDPVEAIKALYDNIHVSEVVSAEDSDHRRSAGSTKITDSGFAANTFLLSAATGALTEDQWSALKQEGRLTIPYTKYNSSRYGDDDMGSIVLTLTKEGSGSDYDAHTANVVGSPAETYTLRAEYQPGAVNTAVDHHTTTGRSAGDPTGTMTSSNAHKINVFATSIQLTKTDESYSETLSGARFALYRTARSGETGSALPGVEGRYVRVEELDSGQNGAVTKQFSANEKLNENEKYYIVETQAPAGYDLTAYPIEVIFKISDSYIPISPSGEETTTRPSSGLYNWTEAAVLTVEGQSGGAYELARDDDSERYILRSKAEESEANISLFIPNAPMKISLPIPIRKILNGRDMKAGEFSFILAPIDVNGNADDSSKVSISNAAGNAFEEVEFDFTLDYNTESIAAAPYMDTSGNAVYYYIVYEEQGNDASIVYSDLKFIVKVTLNLQDGILTAAQTSYPYSPTEEDRRLPEEATRDLRNEAP